MFDQLPDKSPKISLAKLAAILAGTAGISFGLCAVGAISSSGGGRVAAIAAPMAMFFAGLVGLSLIGLLVLAVVAVVRAIIDSLSSKKED
jgi:hypothetical protein